MSNRHLQARNSTPHPTVTKPRFYPKVVTPKPPVTGQKTLQFMPKSTSGSSTKTVTSK